MLRKGSNGTARLPSFLTFGAGTLAALATTAAFIANLVVVSIVRRKIRDDLGAGDVLGFTWGNAVRVFSPFSPFFGKGEREGMLMN